MRKTSIYDSMFDKIQIMECYRGSKAHNLYLPPEDKMGIDDIDTIGVYAYPLQYYLTLEGYNNKKDVFEQKGEFDVVEYELRKMFHLMAGMNPNVIATLFTRKEDYLTITPAWQLVIDNRNLFINKNLAFRTYGGYSRSQFKKMTSYSKEGYMGEKRFKLVEKFGYDTKNAAHLIRLLKMGIEFLRDGLTIVYRTTDREELLSIKKGEWQLEAIKKYADKLFKQLEIEYKKSKLPDKSNNIKINKLLFEVFEIIEICK